MRKWSGSAEEEEGSRSEDIGIIENMSNISNNRNKWSIIRRSLDNDIGTLECLIKEHCRTNNRWYCFYFMSMTDDGGVGDKRDKDEGQEKEKHGEEENITKLQLESEMMLSLSFGLYYDGSSSNHPFKSPSW